MVLVAPLVMQPGRGISLVQALAVVGAAGSGVVFGPHQKLGGRVFGQVVGQSLPVES